MPRTDQGKGGGSTGIDFSLALNNHTAMRQRFLTWLPVFLLVLSQTALLVHQSDIDAHAHGESCHVCLAGHAFDGAPPAAPAMLSDIAATIAPAAEPRSGHRQHVSNVYLARAPPASTHPSV